MVPLVFNRHRFFMDLMATPLLQAPVIIVPASYDPFQLIGTEVGRRSVGAMYADALARSFNETRFNIAAQVYAGMDWSTWEDVESALLERGVDYDDDSS